MLVGVERQIDVHRGQQREHVSLQEDDQQLEERECDTGNDRRNTEDRLESAGHEEEVVRRAEEQHQQDVAANMLAMRRTISVNGRRMKVEMNSMGTNRKCRGSGTPGTTMLLLTYLKKPYF